jgi:hypothetical protein
MPSALELSVRAGLSGLKASGLNSTIGALETAGSGASGNGFGEEVAATAWIVAAVGISACARTITAPGKTIARVVKLRSNDLETNIVASFAETHNVEMAWALLLHRLFQQNRKSSEHNLIRKLLSNHNGSGGPFLDSRT